MSANPTMNDVAREARVALKTVSRFVNGATNINPALAGRIAAAIKSLGYRRNLAAASIRPGWTSKTIGLIIGDLANPYYSTLSRAVETYTRAHGYLLITASSDEDGGRHDQLVDRLMEQRVDGLLVVPPRQSARDWHDIPPPIPPLVFLDRPVDFANADTMLADNAGGSRIAVQKLIENGARRIAFVADSLAVYTMGERYRGYLGALDQAGIAADAKLVDTGAHNAAEAEEITKRILTTTDADAIFAANNRASVGALMAFRELGRRVALIGFDDFEAAPLTEPAVSVVSQDIVEMGYRAAEILIDRLAGDSSPNQTHVLPTTLIMRGSERL